MKWVRKCKFALFSFLVLFLTNNSLFAGLGIRYESPSFSGVVLDDYTGKPIEGAIVQVSWTVVRRTGNEHNPDMMAICKITTTTDTHGVYTIRAWKHTLSMDWELYGADWLHADNPQCSVSIPKNSLEHQPDQIQFDSNRSDVSHGLPIWIKRLQPPEWAISEEEVNARENATPASEISDIDLSNSLAYYVIYGNKIENGRPIDTLGFSSGYVRPTPDLIIKHIKSFSTNLPKDFLYDNWHGLSTEEEWTSVFSITLFQDDAKKIAELDRKCIGSKDLLFMLGNKPLAETHMAMNAGSADSIPIPKGPQTIYLPLRRNQNIQGISEELKKLVSPK